MANHAAITWRDVREAAPEIYGSLQEMAIRYGYEMNGEGQWQI